ncbi:MAG: class I SAM-dependent methyltransferase [Acetobacteraceae bacterium]
MSTTIDTDTLNALMGRILGDLGAAMGAPLVLIGDRLGLYRALAESGPMHPAELAERTGTAERYVREWLAQQAASGYVSHDPGDGRYFMSPEQAAVFADEGGPAFLAGAWDVIAAGFRAEPRIADAFRTGGGMGWHEHHACLFRGTERFFRSSYNQHLVESWLPALDGMVQRLQQGASVADVGCGHGASTILMAQAFPQSRFHGFDYHVPSIERAREAAQLAGVADRVTFTPALSTAYPGSGYDLVTFFDCLHDMGNPVAAAAHVRQTLTPDGAWMIVEPFAHDDTAMNFNPVGRVYYAASTLICTPASLSQDGAMALGAQAGPARLQDVVTKGGFSRFRQAAETPFNLVFEARA